MLKNLLIFSYLDVACLKEFFPAVVITTLSPHLELCPLNLVHCENILHDLTSYHYLLTKVHVGDHEHHNNNINKDPVVQEWFLVEAVFLISRHVHSGKD